MQPMIDPVRFVVKVLMPGKKRWQFLGGGRSLTYLRVHAYQYTNLTAAEAVATEIEEDNLGVKTKVQPF